MSSEDSLMLRSAKENAVRLYHKYLSTHTELYNGIEYVPYPYNIEEGQPFFYADSTGIGNIIYNDVLYEKIPFKFDLVQNAIFISDHFLAPPVQLRNELIGRFNLFGHTFIRVVKDTALKSPLNTGFYDLLYEGKISVLKKETKDIQENLNSGTITRYVESATSYYLKKNGEYFSVNNKSSLLNVLKDKKKEMRQFMNQNKIKIKKDKDVELPKLAAHYDELTK
ncbi:MAG TPA: hypothetical protein VKT28_07715 [Puia sp.]|nr:hypothetical protein [Puia sp.]